jgi:uncharacterized protein with HEPN domain
MPSRNWKLRIQDILESVAAVEGYVAGMTFQEFVRDRRTIDAVVRRFTVIGDAANHVPEEICSRNPRIPWADMRAMRNFVVHEYFGVGEETLWDTIHEDLPGIVEPLQQLLDQQAD